MATINETIVTGRKFRKLIDEANKLWQRISFWTKSSDVEFDDGNDAETKLGAIDGITDSKNSTSSNIAISAKAFSELYSDLDECSLERRQDGVWITYTPPGGADPVSKKLGGSEPVLLHFSDVGAFTAVSSPYIFTEDYSYAIAFCCGGRDTLETNVSIGITSGTAIQVVNKDTARNYSTSFRLCSKLRGYKNIKAGDRISFSGGTLASVAYIFGIE